MLLYGYTACVHSVCIGEGKQSCEDSMEIVKAEGVRLLIALVSVTGGTLKVRSRLKTAGEVRVERTQ